MFNTKNKSELIKELDYLEYIINATSKNENNIEEIIFLFSKIKNIKTTIKRLEKKNILDEVELFEIKNFAITTNSIIKQYEALNLDINYINFQKLDKVVKILDPENLKLNTFHIYNSYSEKLSQIRKSKIEIEEKIFKSKNEEIQNLKKIRLDIVENEEIEELKVKKQLSQSLYSYIKEINTNIKSLGKLDLLIAKGKVAIKYNAIKPNINDKNQIYFEELRNPSVEKILKNEEKKYIPISINLNKKVSIVSGANMGGKSVSLKNIALNMYLFQCGFYVFCKKADLCVLDFVYIISDDMQDINKGLSTFGAEIIKLKEIIKLMKIQNGFIALDEFARGTNPIEGKQLLKAICTYFKDFNSISLISTHLDDIAIEDIDYYQVVGLKNVDFDGLKRKIELNVLTNEKKLNSIDILQEYMDYRLEKVNKEKKVPKDAINICKLLGLDENIINIANKY